MNEYRIIYGGQQTVQAKTEQEAYEIFWELIKKQCDDGELGLIVETKKEGA